MSFVRSTTFEVVHCCKCHMAFAVTQDFEQRRRTDHKQFYCPAGHSQYWPQESDTERLRRQLKASQQREETIANQRDQAERSVRAHKAAHTRTKNRVKAGMCPCCNRYFQNLHRHITGQHPEYV